MVPLRAATAAAARTTAAPSGGANHGCHVGLQDSDSNAKVKPLRMLKVNPTAL